MLSRNTWVFCTRIWYPHNLAIQIHSGKGSKAVHLVDYKAVNLKSKNGPPRPLLRFDIGNFWFTHFAHRVEIILQIQYSCKKNVKKCRYQ